MNLLDISAQKAKELCMANIASDNGHVVFLLPENALEKNKKNPDSVLDGMLTEFKNVTGGENAVSHRFRGTASGH